MAVQRKRLTLDLDAPLQRRLKAVAALKGVSMREYCQNAIERELATEEAQGIAVLPFAEAIDRLEALQHELFGDAAFSGDSVDFIREAREERAAL